MRRSLMQGCLMRWPLLPALVLAACSVLAETVDRDYLLEHYTKYEYLVPMRDGIELYTAVYAPKADQQRYPLLLTRTPYSARPYSTDAYPEPRGVLQNYARDGFIFVFQDVRGRYGSQGEFVHMRPHIEHKRATDVDESTDTYDTVDWLVRHVPNNNGKVGLIGLSYPGFYAAAGMIDGHPALKCVSPQAPITDWFIGDDFHQNGALGLAHAFRFFSLFGQKLTDPTRQAWTPFDYRGADGYQFFLDLGPVSQVEQRHFQGTREFWHEMMTHGTYDAFWRARNIRPHLGGVRAAVMTVGGWYDAENLYGALEVYRNTERRNPGIVNTLVMGPWRHGAWMMGPGESLGPLHFHARTSEFYRREIELPFLNHHLKGAAAPRLPEAYMFETGTWQWRRHDTWPPRQARTEPLALTAEGGLVLGAADARADNGPATFEEYVSDPAKPVPYTTSMTTSVAADYMVADQRFVSSRTDVLSFKTPVLEQDVTLAGPIEVQLRVATTGTDSDWVVKLIDVYSGDHPAPQPNPAQVVLAGYQQLVRGGIMRGKFRNGFEQPQPFVPGEATLVKFTLPDIYHTFRRGHRLMVQIQSSWFPLFDRNPQTFTDIYSARASDFKQATQRVYVGGTGGSRLLVNVLGTP